ncbi:hypothetical protein OB905_11820 [Halobacteria archaeon AArc-dxtr1]|nr:hypothetical protein [Halobacteria archaeon AArc-dxtr1]
MTETGFYCPVTGCDKHEDESITDSPPFDSREALIGHITAMSDEDHQRAREMKAWRDAPEAPGPGSETPHDPPESGDDEGSDDPPEVDDDPGSEAGPGSDDPGHEAGTGSDDHPDEGDNEGDHTPDEDEMVSQDEYEAQQTQQNSSSEGDNEGTDDPPQGGSNGSLPTPSLPNVSPMWTVVIIAAVFAAIVLWRVHRAKSSSAPAVEPQEENNSDPNEVPLFE